MRFSERQAGGELLKLCGHTDKLIMMGQHDRSEALFYYFRLEDHVLETHLLRLIEKHISFAFVREKLKESYSDTVRPSIDPELLLRIHLRRPSCHLHFSLAARRRTIHSGWPTTDSAIGTGAAGGLKREPGIFSLSGGNQEHGSSSSDARAKPDRQGRSNRHPGP